MGAVVTPCKHYPIRSLNSPAYPGVVFRAYRILGLEQLLWILGPESKEVYYG